MGPEPRGPHRAPSPILSDYDNHRLGMLLALLALIVVAALVAYVVVRIANRRTPPQPVVVPVGPPIEDAAMAQLRLRYARGEISRTDYLQASADLGARPPEQSSA